MVDAAPRAKYTSNSTVLNYSNCGLCKMLRPTMLRYVSLKCCDRLAGACKCWANIVGIFCVETLLSFGRGLKLQLEQ